MSTTKVIETHEGHDVTESTISCNLGSGLMESMRIAGGGVWKTGDIIDAVVRMRVGETGHKPVHKDDYDGPYRRIHRAKALAVAPTKAAPVGKILDEHIAQVSKARELPGQASIEDEIVDLDARRTRKKASPKPEKKTRPSRAKKSAPALPEGEPVA